MKKLTTSLFTLTLTWSSMGQEAIPFERKMYDIYKQSYSEEISDERWAGYLQGVGNRTYQVSPGDTLWDLSVVFFGDGLFWSKIWSYNARLTNPHLLAVGQEIQFYTGSVEQPPGIQVRPEEGEMVPSPAAKNVTQPDSSAVADLPEGFVEVKVEQASADASQGEGEESTVVMQDADLAEQTLEAVGEAKSPQQKPETGTVVHRAQLYPGAPKLPPPSKMVKPVLQVLPNSFANSDTYDVAQYDAKGISFDLRPPVRVNPLFVADSFLYGKGFKNYPRVGRLLESEDKLELVGQNQLVYIRSSESLDIGERLTVMGQEYPFDRNGVVGDVIKYQATVEITEKMKDKLYRGLVIKSISGIKGQPWISREEIPAMPDDYVGRPNGKRYQVIGGGQDNKTRFYGQSDVIFLQGGSRQGIRVGDIMGVYKRRDLRYRNTIVNRAPLPIGHIKVFRVEPNLTSAFVISSDDIIIPGDETGAPTMVESVTTESEKMDLNEIETGLDFDSETRGSGTGDVDDEFESEIE